MDGLHVIIHLLIHRQTFQILLERLLSLPVEILELDTVPSHLISYLFQGINFSTWRNSKDSYSRFFAYGQSKLANVLFSNQLAIKLNGTGATSNALHPGIITTDALRHVKTSMNSNPISQIIHYFLQIPWNAALMNVNDGALTQLFVATSPTLEGITGRYFVPMGLDRTDDTSIHARNVTLANLVWIK